MTTADDLAQVCANAATAAPILATTTPEDRIGWLTAAAAALDAERDELAATAAAETQLDIGRLRGEVGRTTGQLRLFAQMIRDGGYLEVTIDYAARDVTPPVPDLRRVLVPLGPVAVFAASNFPFAFSVAGGDTASALAVGCPVVVKAHEGHPETSRRTAAIVEGALRGAGAPVGTFALIEGREAGVQLIQHPAIKAAAFTGSVAGGRALFDLASRRPDPIPFYGELGSINPVVITPAAVAARGAELAAGLVGSFTLGSGQFCTKPGVVFVPAEFGFEQQVRNALPGVRTGGLLTEGITRAFETGVSSLRERTYVEVLAESPPDGAVPTPIVFGTSTEALDDPALFEEHFGPAVMLVRYRDDEDLLAALRDVPGSLTGTIHAEPGEDVSAVASILGANVGRLLFGGWPTGVAVTWSQHHGGPWPATTSVFTSVGVTAARRFQRPLVLQDAPEEALPDALREDNPLRVPRRVDGVLQLTD